VTIERTGRSRITEVKRQLDGTEQRFDCELVHRSASLVVVCYEMRRADDQPDRWLDSYGFFWPRRPYNCYHIVRPASGKVVLSRFDVLRDVDLGILGEVGYTDLLLDLRVERDGLRWEDDDELAEAVAAGRVTAAELAHVERARGVLERGHGRIIAEVRRTLTSLGRFSR
jgi:hypothetical protein